MCGIAGFSGALSASQLGAMSDAIAHRGPDDAGVFLNQEAGVGLAHRRLSIIDLSASGHQPMWDTTERALIVFNGEIYNYRELRSGLEADGFRFRGTSDTEVLVNLYLRHGEKMLEALNGIFAFAIWDAGAKTLLVARDQLGVKPLYFAQTRHAVLFASELKALLACEDLDRSPCPEAIQDYLTYLWCPAPRTMFHSVQKLRPGHAMRFRAGQIERIWRYYQLPFTETTDSLSVRDSRDLVAHAIRRAVQRQLVADVPIGAFLSGGLDSSAVVAMYRDIAPSSPIQCFTIELADEEMRREGFSSDLPFARQVARHLSVDLHELRLEPSAAELLPKMIYHLDEPQADPAPLNVYFISQAARRSGLKVLLSGAGGDDIFTGYRRHYALMQERLWAWWPASLRRGTRAVASRFPARYPLARRLAKAFAYAERPPAERIAAYFHWLPPDVVMSLLSPDLRATLDARPFSAPLMETLAQLPPGVHPLNQMLALEITHFLADHNLSYTDKLSMAEGVEVRVPLLDLDLVSLAARLPLSHKRRGREGKWIFKKAMESFLPRGVIYRPKTGFGAPLRYWLQNQLRPWVDEIIDSSGFRHRGIFDPVAARALVKADRQGRVDAAYPIFAMLSIELWFRIFVDRTLSPGRLPAAPPERAHAAR